MKNINLKKINTDLKFVYSDNGTLSIIFQSNALLSGVVGEFNKNLKQIEKALRIKVLQNGTEFELKGKLFLIGHGDGLGPHDKGYKRLKKVFSNPFFKWLYRWIHPDFGVLFAQYLSQKNKLISGDNDLKFKGNESEWLTQYARRKLEHRHYDYFLFGHRHLPLEVPLNQKSTYFNLGDWITHFSYGVFDGREFKLEKYNTD